MMFLVFVRVPISETQKHHFVVYPGKVNIELLYNELLNLMKMVFYSTNIRKEQICLKFMI